MTKKEFNKIRSKLEMQEIRNGLMAPKTDKEKFVAEIIKRKRDIDKEVESYKSK